MNPCPTVLLSQQHARAVLVLLDPDACAIEFDPVRAETRACSLIQQHLQSAAMDAHFGKLVAGRLAARLAIDQLPEAIVEAVSGDEFDFCDADAQGDGAGEQTGSTRVGRREYAGVILSVLAKDLARRTETGSFAEYRSG